MVPSDRASKMRDRMIEKIKAADSRVGDWGPGGYDTERCSVTTPSGNEYTAIVRGTKVWENHPDFQFEDHNGSMMIEGQGEAFSVFTGMANAFMRYVKEKQPQTMTFSGSGPSRAKVYTRFAKMLKHLLPHNYKVYASKHNEYLDGSYAEFKIERK